MGEEGFWDDSERAAAVSAEHSRASRQLEMFNTLSSDVADLEPLVEMAVEETSLQAEVDDQIANLDFYKPADDSAEMRYLRSRRAALPRRCQTRIAP